MDYSSDDEPILKKRKKVKPDKAKSSKHVAATKKRKREPDPAPSSSTPAKKAKAGKELKKLDKAERLQYAMQSFLWWNAKEHPEGCQWLTMEHAGVSFPEPYTPHRVKMNYDGKPVELTPMQEEA
jgi:DNA topoisomerase-1